MAVAASGRSSRHTLALIATRDYPVSPLPPRDSFTINDRLNRRAFALRLVGLEGLTQGDWIMGFDVYVERFDSAGNQLRTGHAYFPDKDKAEEAYKRCKDVYKNRPNTYVSIFKREED